MGFLGFLVDLSMIIIPPLPYMGQISKIKRTRSSEGFSRTVPLLTLAGAILRLAFWVGRRFSNVLVIQSVLVILTQVYLMYLVVKYDGSSATLPQVEVSPNGVPIRRDNDLLCGIFPPWETYKKHFWHWTSFDVYIGTLVFFFFATIGVAILFLPFSWFSNLLGIVCQTLEAVVAVPQLIRNYKTHTTEGLSLLMVSAWVAGDFFKIVYVLVTQAPIHFFCANLFQLLVDCSIIFQFATYHSKPSPETK